MSQSSGNGSIPVLHRIGLAGALARFGQRSYAADYIALGFISLAWVVVSRSRSDYDIQMLTMNYFF